jgi:hypothetical protein
LAVVDKETKKNSVIFDGGTILVIDSKVDVEGGSLYVVSGVNRVVHEASGRHVTGFKCQVMP